MQICILFFSKLLTHISLEKYFVNHSTLPMSSSFYFKSMVPLILKIMEISTLSLLFTLVGLCYPFVMQLFAVFYYDISDEPSFFLV